MKEQKDYEREELSSEKHQRTIFDAQQFYGNPQLDHESIQEEIHSLISSQKSGIIFGPEGVEKKQQIIRDTEGHDIGFIDLRTIEDIALQDIPKEKEYNFFEYTGDILENPNKDAYVIFACSLLRKPEIKTVLDYLERFTDNSDKIIQVWNYSDYLSLQFEEPMYLERYGKNSISFRVKNTIKSNKILKDSKETQNIHESLGDSKISPTRLKVFETLLSGVRGEYPSHSMNHYSTREIKQKIEEKYSKEISKNTVSTHISNINKFNILHKEQQGREVKYSLKNSIIKIYLESLLYEDKYGN